MTDDQTRQIVLALWHAFDSFTFDAVGPLLHDEFVCEWPQSRERIRGRANFIAVNAHYPGRWHIAVQRIIVSGAEAVTEIIASDGAQQARAVSFFTLQDGLIVHLREFWPDPYPAQDWRAAWVEIMEDKD